MSISKAVAKDVGDVLGIDWRRVPLEEFRRGLEVELEHGRAHEDTNITDDDLVLTGKIALAHLHEFYDYYTRLDMLEARAKAGLAPNPPWANRILSANADRIAARFGSDALALLSEWREPKPAYEELGCGHYGCVYPTKRKGVVLKLTSDPTEAWFVAVSKKAKLDTTGLVRYFDAAALPETYRGRPVFVIWREEAFDVGALRRELFTVKDRYEFGARNLLARRLEVFKFWANKARLEVRAAEKAGKKAELLAGIRDLGNRDTWHWVEGEEIHVQVPRTRDAGLRLSVYLEALQICAVMMQNEYLSDSIGQALGDCLELGIVLADVHLGNIGRVHREDYTKPPWIITDPGHAFPINTKFDQIKLESL